MALQSGKEAASACRMSKLKAEAELIVGSLFARQKFGNSSIQTKTLSCLCVHASASGLLIIDEIIHHGLTDHTDQLTIN